jgi:hypothetical protein
MWLEVIALKDQYFNLYNIVRKKMLQSQMFSMQDLLMFHLEAVWP